jgi:hypothetical protein
MSAPAINGIHAALCTVTDFAAHEVLFCGALGWQAGSRRRLSAIETHARLQVAAEAEVLQLTAPGASSGEVWLIRFSGTTPRRLGYPPIRVAGFFAIDLYVRDIDEAVRRIELKGFACAGKATWQVATPAGTVTVRQAKIDGPDDVSLVLVNPEKPRYTATWAQEPTAFATELTSVVVGSSDVEASKMFWGEGGLGLPIIYDSVFSQPEMSRMCGIEEDSAFRMAFGVGESTARLEIVGRAKDPHETVPSADLAPRQRPGGSLGQSAWVVRVNHLDSAIEAATARGASVIRPAARHWGLAGPQADERCAAVLSPEGIWLELIERA